MHPPLYYILLKGFTESIRFVLPQVPTIYLARLFSGIPYAFLLIFLLSMRKTIEDRLISDIMLLALCMPEFYGLWYRSKNVQSGSGTDLFCIYDRISDLLWICAGMEAMDYTGDC